MGKAVRKQERGQGNGDRMGEFGKRYSLFCIEKDWELFPRVDFLLPYTYQGLPVPYPFRETGCGRGKAKIREGRAATDKNHIFFKVSTSSVADPNPRGSELLLTNPKFLFLIRIRIQ